MPECTGISEIDKYAFAIFRRHFPHVENFGDATKLIPDDLPDFELLVAGFPCQAFSIAGKRQGFNEARGTLFFEIARVLSHKRPRHFLLENVKGLGSHDEGETQNQMLGILSDLGYFVERPLLNSKDHGVPQNRERIYFIGHLGTECSGEVLSIGYGGEPATEGDRMTENIAYALDSSYAKGAGHITDCRRTVVNGSGRITVGTLRTHKDGEGFREMQSGVAPALNARARQDGSGQGVISVPRMTKLADGSQGQRVYDGEGIAATLRTCETANEKYLIDDRIRRFTPKECERLQAFRDNWTALGLFDVEGQLTELPISDTQRYKTLGNAVTTATVETIIRRMREVGCLA